MCEMEKRELHSGFEMNAAIRVFYKALYFGYE